MGTSNSFEGLAGNGSNHKIIQFILICDVGWLIL